MMDWLLTIMGCSTFLLAGEKVWWAWYLGLATQVVWIIYALVTVQYGFLLGVPLYGAVYARNAYKWTKEKFTEPLEESEPLFVPRTFVFAVTHRRAVQLAEENAVNPHARNTIILHADSSAYEGYHFKAGDNIIREDHLSEDQIQFIRRNLLMNKLTIEPNGYLREV